ncbi:MAG TPA: hypothetical protein V6D20_23060 [Candidatus Obscuribacterales bacterium]
MVTQFVTLELPLALVQAERVIAIEQALAVYGDPLRWAITQVDADRQVAIVEAVVMQAIAPGRQDG